MNFDFIYYLLGTPLNIFKIHKNLTEKKLRGFYDLEGKNGKISNLLVAHHLLGVPLVTEKNLVSNFFLESFFKK